MKKFFLSFFLLVFAVQAWSQDLFLSCSAKHNSRPVFERSLVLKQNQKQLLVASFNGLEIFISSLGGSKVELQLYIAQDPSRSYAMATLTPEAQEADLSIWRREFIFETKCRLL